MKRAEAVGICLVFAGLLLAPGMAWLGGVRSIAFENRALAPRPDFELRRALSTDYYAGVSTWMEDHLSLRRAAVTAVATADLRVFGDSPDPQVWLGKGDWLWFDDGIRKACTGPEPLVALTAISEVERLLRESGRALRWTIVPNKIAFYPEHATDRVTRAAACGEGRRDDLFAAMREQLPGGYINLFGAFGQTKQRFEHPLYYPDDSHVSAFGSALLLQQIVGSIQPEIWDPRALRQGRPTRRTGDLARMLVIRDPIDAETWAILRPQVSPGPTENEDVGRGQTLRRFRTEGPDSLLVSAPTFFLHDSQFNTAMAMSRTYFGDSTFLTWNAFEPQRVASEMARSRIVVIEIVERDLFWRVPRQLGSPEFIRALAATLRASG
jgi:hypothetical protein